MIGVHKWTPKICDVIYEQCLLYVFDIRGLLFNNNVHLLSFQIPADMILECHSPPVETEQETGNCK